MAYLEIFNAPLVVGFAPSRPIIIFNERVTLDFELIVTVAATVRWFPEFSGDPVSPATRWFREVDEETAAGGVISMAQTIRSLQANGGGTFGIGTHRMTAQLVRAHQLARIQLEASVGTVTAIVRVPGGTLAQS